MTLQQCTSVIYGNPASADNLDSAVESAAAESAGAESALPEPSSESPSLWDALPARLSLFRAYCLLQHDSVMEDSK